MNTRGLTGLTSSRVADMAVDAIYNVLVPNDDGSSENVPYVESLRGSIVALQPKDIQRLQEGGITVHNGISLLLKGAREEHPDRIVVKDKIWRVINWTFVFEFTESCGGSGYVERGTVVAVCDEILVGNAS